MDNHKLIEIANFEIDCKIGKARHFIAADRKNIWRIYLGLFAVVGSALISSGIGQGITGLGKFYPEYFGGASGFSVWSDFLKHILPLLVGISTAIIGFLGLEKQTTQHRAVGNAYTEIARRARSILNSINPLNYATKMEDYEKLVERYLEVNKEGESCPTNDRDSSRAMGMNSRARTAIKKKIAEYENISLGLTELIPPTVTSLRKCLVKAARTRAATVLASAGLIRRSDYRRYLKNIR